MDITIRLAIPADSQDMAEVVMSSWEIAYKDILSVDYIHEKNASRLEQFKRNITNENNDQYVIQIDGKTIGIMKIALPADDDLDDTFYEVHYIYLHPDYFRRGIGTQAIKFAFDKAHELGKMHVSIWVFSENTNTIKFYEKCGFKRDGKTAMQDRGKPVEIIRMQCSLFL